MCEAMNYNSPTTRIAQDINKKSRKVYVYYYNLLWLESKTTYRSPSGKQWPLVDRSLSTYRAVQC